VRYVVVGAGAVGGTVGGRLYDAGHDVVLVARGPHAEAMQRDGLRLALPDRVLTVRAPVVTSLGEITFGPEDVVLLATKTQDSSAALDDLVAVGADGPVVCMQNGVANERMALRRFDAVYGVVVMLPAVLLEPGRIDAQGHPFTGLLDIGRVPSDADDLAARIAADLSGSGFVSQPQPDIMRWKYAKLLRNLGNAIEALGGHDVDGDELAAIGELDRRLREEALACFAAAGIAWTSDEEWVAHRQEQVQHTPVEGRTRAGGSTWQSLVRGTGSLEVDYLNGEICFLGRSHGVPTPLNAMVQRLATRVAATGAQPGSMRPTELLAQADIAEKESPDG
jgi:2-dehydropantoate 2-reductase